MAWQVTWAVVPFENQADRDARKSRCRELAAQGWKRTDIARELHVHSYFVWRSLLSEEKRQGYVDRRREHRQATARDHTEMVRCRGCGKERLLGRESLRKIRNGTATGLCESCGMRRAKKKAAAAMREAEGIFVPLTEFELYSWARKVVSSMTPEERKTVAALSLPDDDHSMPARHASPKRQRTEFQPHPYAPLEKAFGADLRGEKAA